jgi:molecular chaperone IbpA
MRTFDFTPLFRSSVGFDRLQHLLDTATRVDETAFSYPPYNIEALDEDTYRIAMAIAGFSEDDLDITVKENTLVVSGKALSDEDKTQYLHRGIAGRSFERRFDLADHIKVTDASLTNGLLHIDLVREVPEEKRPRKIAITKGSAAKVIEDKAA